MTSPWLAGAISWGPTPFYLAQLSGLLGNWSDAVELFERAETMARAANLRPWLAWIDARYAQALIKSRQPDAQRRALALVETARAIATETNMPAVRATLDGMLVQ